MPAPNKEKNMEKTNISIQTQTSPVKGEVEKAQEEMLLRAQAVRDAIDDLVEEVRRIKMEAVLYVAFMDEKTAGVERLLQVCPDDYER